MALKIVLLGIMAFIITAADPDYGSNLFNMEPKIKRGDVVEISWLSPDAVRPFITDSKNRVSKTFKVTPYYFPTVYFWFLVYTQFESSQVVIHDKNNLKLIYKVLDFSSLHEKELSLFTLHIVQKKLSEEKLDDLRKTLDHLAMNPYSLEPRAKLLYRTIMQSGIQLPIPRAARSAYFTNLKKNIRTQTGQKNFIRDGLVRSLAYQEFIAHYLKQKDLPKEIFSIPFLESSFNPVAESKVAALGIWQFMPLIGSYYMPKKANGIDYRSNVGVASVAAAFLLSENFKIMKKWDLAVTAYNSGTKHLLHSKRQLASTDVDLEDIIQSSDSERFGFASKNFYSEFLALAHTLAYREELFHDLHDHERSDVEEELKFYLTKCSLRLDKSLDEKQLDDVAFHNNQLDSMKIGLSRGSIVTSKSALPSGKFMRLNMNEMVKLKPKSWAALLKNQSCSTR